MLALGQPSQNSAGCIYTFAWATTATEERRHPAPALARTLPAPPLPPAPRYHPADPPHVDPDALPAPSAPTFFYILVFSMCLPPVLLLVMGV